MHHLTSRIRPKWLVERWLVLTVQMLDVCRMCALKRRRCHRVRPGGGVDLVAIDSELLEPRVNVFVGVQDPVECEVLQRVGLFGGQAIPAGWRQPLRDLQEDGLHCQLQHTTHLDISSGDTRLP